jgi:malate dehydrogenase
MFANGLRTAALRAGARQFSATGAKNFKVAVLGAAGGIGQPLATLLRLDPLVTDLRLYDVAPVTPGVAVDLAHIPANGKVEGFVKGTPDAEAKAMGGVEIVVIPAGVPRKPGMTRDDLFNTNASIVRDLVADVAKHSPNAFVLIIANPVNSTVPIASAVLKGAGCYDPKRLFGVTTLDIIRADTFVSAVEGTSVGKNIVTVGGHSGPTIVPIISQYSKQFTQEQLDGLVHRIQYGGDEVVQAKDGGGSATLSMAVAGHRFTNSLMRAIKGEKDVVECTFTENDVGETQFFSLPTTLGPSGVEKVHPIGEMSAFEKSLYDACIPELKGNIKKGFDFVAANPPQ